jgi:hypothetical protein
MKVKTLPLKLGGVFLAILAAMGLLLPVTVATRTIQTCVLCRAEREDRSLLGYSWLNLRDTAFTYWYREHRPAHEHAWGRLSCTRGFSILGTTTYFGCAPRHPVCRIPSETLRAFAERSDTNTLNAFFEGITSTDRETQNKAVQIAWERILEEK